MKYFIYVIHVIITIVIIALSVVVSEELDKSEYNTLYNSLISISAIIFGVLGAWIALLKNDAEVRILDIRNTREKRQVRVDQIKSLVNPMMIACLMICICIIYNVFSSIVPKFSFYLEYSYLFKFLALSLFGILSYLQVASLLRIIITGVDSVIGLQQLADEVSSNAQR